MGWFNHHLDRDIGWVIHSRDTWNQTTKVTSSPFSESGGGNSTFLWCPKTQLALRSFACPLHLLVHGNLATQRSAKSWWLMVGYRYRFLGPFGLLKMEHVCYKGKSLKNYHRFWGVEWVVMQKIMVIFNWSIVGVWCHIMPPGMNNSIHDVKSLPNATLWTWLRVQVVNCE